MFSSLRARAPGKLFLLGEHAVLYGSRALITSLNLHISATLTPRKDDQISIITKESSLSCNRKSFKREPGLLFVTTVIQNYLERIPSGFQLEITSDFPSTLGLGSSSAVTVVTLALLKAYIGEEISKEKLFQEALEVVRAVQQTASGGDLAAAVFGGLVLYNMEPLTIRRINSKPPLFAVNSGKKKKTTLMIHEVRQRLNLLRDCGQSLIHLIDQLVGEAITALEQRDWEYLGLLMNTNHHLLAAIGAVDQDINHLFYQITQQKGVYGVKISGSGQGDNLIALGTPNSLSKKMKIFPVIPDKKGLQID